jgi:hypothetical protein
MGYSHSANKRDANEEEIVEALKGLGCSVDKLDGGNGRPDLLIGEPKTRLNLLFEVKGEGGKLNTKQKPYHAAWQGRIHLVRTPAEAREIVFWYRKVNRRDSCLV